jgi:hypothetical protein
MDVERVARDNNIEFGFVRTNYGANHDDAYFHRHADALERAGAIVLPYVYPLASDTRGSIDDAVRIIGGRYKACIVDWENDSGDGSHLRLAHELLWQRGFSTPVVYDPKWYWERMGSPDVSWMQGKVKGHWKSWYADNVPKPFDAALAQVPGYVWQDNRGGIPTVIVQFTGTGRLSGYGGNLDLNYFPGTRAELAALLGSTQEGEDEMSADELLDTVIDQEFSKEIAERLGIQPDKDGKYIKPGVSLRVLERWSDNRHESLRADLAEIRAKQDEPVELKMSDEDRAAIVSAVQSSMNATVQAAVRNALQTMQANLPAGTATFSPKPPTGQ